MGGCATKPKVLKGDGQRDDVAPAPMPAPSNSPPAPLQEEEVAGAAVEEAGEENDAKEGVPVVADHDSDTKNSSLGNLFKENQEGKDSGEKEKEMVKIADVSETINPTKEVEKTIPEEDTDSSLKKEEDAEEKKTEEEKEVVGEISEKKKPDEVNFVTPEEKNLDPIKPRITDPEEKLEIPQPQEKEEKEEKEDKKETEESMKQNPLPPAPAPDQEKFATSKEKPEENNAIPEVLKAEEDNKEKPEEVKQKTLN